MEFCVCEEGAGGGGMIRPYVPSSHTLQTTVNYAIVMDCMTV